MKKILAILICLFSVCSVVHSADRDTVPGAFTGKLQGRVGMEVFWAKVIPTNDFVRGRTQHSTGVNYGLGGGVHGDFSFNPKSEWGRLYHGLYQGAGVQLERWDNSSVIGNPNSLFVYQGAPIKRFSDRLWLGYEWRFGAAFGWKTHTTELWEAGTYPPISTKVTAHMGVALKLTYQPAERWQIHFGVDATHFSNGNTSFPNSGINTIGLSAGFSYLISPQEEYQPTEAMVKDADRKRWLWDVMAYGAWRKRGVMVNDVDRLLDGTYSVFGCQFTALRKFNRYFNAGVKFNMKHDASAGKAEYWGGGEFYEGRFDKVPFFKQCSLGLGVVAEFEMPVFTVGIGVGEHLLCPKGDGRFYQLFYLKTFITKHIYLNTGYRLSNFKDPQHLMLGAGYRF